MTSEGGVRELNLHDFQIVSEMTLVAWELSLDTHTPSSLDRGPEAAKQRGRCGELDQRRPREDHPHPCKHEQAYDRLKVLPPFDSCGA